jgi:molybdopterin molybdotransferase
MDEDFKKGETVIARGKKLRPPEMGLLAAFGKDRVSVYKKPVIGIVSTGDEIIPVDQTPAPGEIRDTNTYTLSGLIDNSGGSAVSYGIVKDNYDSLYNTVKKALAECDMVLISGGSSVGSRDYTIDVLSGLPDSEIWVHGISISPGKPTILARSGKKAVWGLPGHVVSAMIVYEMVVRPFTDRLSGYAQRKTWTIPAILSRNIPSVQGREDFVRVRLKEMEGKITAEPVLGKSGLLHTMIRADGLIRIDKNTEGLDKNAVVRVIPV